MKKSSQLYLLIIAVWIGLASVSFVPLLQAIQGTQKVGTVAAVLVTTSTLFIVYFWLNGVKDVVYTLFFYAKRKKFTVPPKGEWRFKNGNAANKKMLPFTAPTMTLTVRAWRRVSTKTTQTSPLSSWTILLKKRSWTRWMSLPRHTALR